VGAGEVQLFPGDDATHVGPATTLVQVLDNGLIRPGVSAAGAETDAQLHAEIDAADAAREGEPASSGDHDWCHIETLCGDDMHGGWGTNQIEFYWCRTSGAFGYVHHKGCSCYMWDNTIEECTREELIEEMCEFVDGSDERLSRAEAEELLRDAGAPAA